MAARIFIELVKNGSSAGLKDRFPIFFAIQKNKKKRVAAEFVSMEKSLDTIFFSTNFFFVINFLKKSLFWSGVASSSSPSTST